MSNYVRVISIAVMCFVEVGIAEAQDSTAVARDEVNLAVTASGEAYLDNDPDRYFSFFADDAVIVNSDGQEQTIDEIYTDWKGQIASGGGVSNIDVNHPRSIRLSADGNTAVVHQLSVPISYRVPDESVAGGFISTTTQYAITDVWERIDGSWKIVHEHYHESASNGDDE